MVNFRCNNSFQLSYLIGCFLLLSICSTSSYFPGWLSKKLTVTRQKQNNGIQTQTEEKKKMRILCLILTTASRTNQTTAVNQTWAKRCDMYKFVIGGQPRRAIQNDIMYVTSPEGNNHLVVKVRHALTYAYNLYKGSYDWYLKCDDDSYIIIENLRHLLSSINPNKPAHIGLAMKSPSGRPYMSGSGYLISSEGLRRLVTIGYKHFTCIKDGNSEDVATACLLARSGVPMYSSLDSRHKETFHHVPLKRYFYPPLPESLYQHSWHKVLKSGTECCSKYSVCFHKVSPQEQYVFEHLLYSTRVFGLQKEQKDDVPIFNPQILIDRKQE